MARMNPIEKAEANPKSMRASINAFCYVCKEKSKKKKQNMIIDKNCQFRQFFIN